MNPLHIAECLLLLLVAPAAFAQTNLTGSLTGHVFEVSGPSKRALPGIRIDVIKADTGKWGSTESNDQGAYEIKALPAGEYYLLANCLNPNLEYETCVPPNPNREFSSYFSRKAPERIGQTIRVFAMQPNQVQAPPVYLKRVRQSPQGTDGLLAEVSPDNIAPSLGPEQAVSSHGLDATQATPPPEVANEPLRRQLVNTTNATRQGVMEAERLTALPLPGIRTIETLAVLLPGVAPAPSTISQSPGPGIGAGVGTSGQFAVNGLRSRGNNFTIDGSDNNDEDIGVRRQGFTALLPQTVESIQEYQLTTLLPTAQFGRNLGAQVNLVSRTGTPRFHGSAAGFFTNARLKAREFFDLTGGPATFPIETVLNGKTVPVLLNNQPLAPANPVGGEDPFSRTQISFTLGGPLSDLAGVPAHPALTKDTVKRQLLFFLSGEQQLIDADKETHFAVPNIAARGLFGSGTTGLRNPFGASPPILYPTSVQGDAVFSLFPFPNNSRGPYGNNTFTQVLPADAQGSIFSLRLDRAFGNRARATGLQNDQSLAGRYNFTDDNTVLPAIGGAIASSMRALVRTQNLALYHIANLRSQTTNELRFSYGRTRLRFREIPNELFLPSKLLPDVPFLLNARVIKNGTLGNPSCNGQAGTEGYPCLDSTQQIETENRSLLGPLGQMIVSGYSPVGVDVFNFPQARVNNTYQWADTLFTQQGGHHLIAGIDLRRTHLDSTLERNFRPLLLFNGVADIAALPPFNQKSQSPSGYYLGSDFAAAGAATGFFQTLALNPDSFIRLRYWQTNFFMHDEWRLRPSFALSIGLRYEYNTVPGEVDKRIETTFNSDQVNSLIAAEKKISHGVSGFESFLANRTQIFGPDRNNFAPHLAFAWMPNGKGATSIRGGYGIYFDQIPGAVTSQSRNVFPRFLTVNVAGVNPFDPGSNDLQVINPNRFAVNRTLNTFEQRLACSMSEKSFGTDLVAFLLCLNRLAPPLPPSPGAARVFPGGPGFVLPAADLHTPYSQQWGLTIEREFKRDFLVALAYTGTRGIHLLRFATPNLGPNTISIVNNGRNQGLSTIFQGFTVAPGKSFERPFPLLGSFTSIESDANSIYHSFQAEFTKRLSGGLQFTTAYTWSHVIDEVSDLFELASGPVLPQNTFKRRSERASASFDIQHNFTYSLVWDLPAPPHYRWFPARLRAGLKDWRLSSLGALRSGQPFSLLACCDVNLDGNRTDRLNTLTNIAQHQHGRTRFEVAGDPEKLLADLLAQPGMDGALGRNTLRGPGTAIFDLALSKRFSFKEARKLELRVEVFNLFNRAHFGLPVHELLFPGFGQAVDTRLPARTCQLAGKFIF